MPDEVTTPAVTEPEVTDDASVAKAPAGDTGSDPVADRDAGFLAMLEGRNDETATVDEPKQPAKDEPKPDEKVVEPPDAKVAVPDAPEDEDEEDDDEILSREEIDKRFSNSPKGLRKYADNLGKKYAPVAQAIEELGGIDAVKRLDTVASLVMSSPTRADAPEVVDFVKHLRATNPAFAGQLNTNIFYGAIDEDPTLLNSVIQLPRTFDDKGKPTGGFGPEWSVEKLMKLTELVDAGEIDMDEVQAVAERKVDPAELERRKAQALKDKARDDEIAELRKGQEETLVKKKSDAVKADIDDLGDKLSKARESVWRRFKLLPVEGEPEDIAKMKQSVIKAAILLTSMDFANDQTFINISSAINGQAYDKESDSFVKGDQYGWGVEKAIGLTKSRTTEVMMSVLNPLWIAYLKQYNQPAAKNATTRRPEPLADGSLASERAPSPTDKAQQPLTQEQRRESFQAMLEGKTGTR